MATVDNSSVTAVQTAEPAPSTVPSLTPAQLYERIFAGKPTFILDVRNEEDVARWPIEGHRIDTINIPYFEFFEDEEESIARLPEKQREMLVVCAKGGASAYIAEMLQERGYKATNLENGMIGLGHYYDLRDVASGPYGRVVQVARLARGDLSFALISKNEMLVVDPLRHIEHYLKLADEAGATITQIVDTHAHADHISGGPELAERTGAPYYLHPYDAIHPIDMLPARIPFIPIADGQHIALGDFDVEIIWLPGHTLGMVNVLARTGSGEEFIFTGDGIFLRSFGRPDLGGQADAWAPVLHESLFKRFPERVTGNPLLLPGHFSLISESSPGGIFAAPLRRVLSLNENMSLTDKDEFVDFVLSHLPIFPPQYIEIKRVNLGLVTPSEEEANELELGKNICAVDHTTPPAF